MRGIEATINAMNRAELLTSLRDSTQQMLAHASAPEAELDRSYGPGKWTAREVLAHLADVELVNLWRFLKAVAEPGSQVEVFDEQRWAEKLQYASRPGAISAEQIRGARALLLHLVETLPEAALSNGNIHPEKGVMTGSEWARLIDDHARHHLGQIDAARRGETWIPPAPGPTTWKYTGKPRPDQA